MNEQDCFYIEFELDLLEDKIKYLYPSDDKKKLSQKAYDLIRHIDEVRWCITNRKEKEE